MKEPKLPFTDSDLSRVRAAIAQIEKEGGKVSRRRVQQVGRIDMRVVLAAMRHIETEAKPATAISPQVRALGEQFVVDIIATTTSAFESKLAAAEGERDDALARAADAESALNTREEQQTAVLAGHLETVKSTQAEKLVLAEGLRRAEGLLDAARQTELELRATVERLQDEVGAAREAAAKALGTLEGLLAAGVRKARGTAS